MLHNRYLPTTSHMHRVDEIIAHNTLKALNNLVKGDPKRIELSSTLLKQYDFLHETAKLSPVASGELTFANISTGCAVPFNQISSSLDAFLTVDAAPMRIMTGRYGSGFLLPWYTHLFEPQQRGRWPYDPSRLLTTASILLCHRTTEPSPHHIIHRPAPDNTWMLFMGSLSDVIVLLSLAAKEIPLIQGNTCHGKPHMPIHKRAPSCTLETDARVSPLSSKLNTKTTIHTHAGKIVIHIPDNDPQWAGGIVPILNSGKLSSALR